MPRVGHRSPIGQQRWIQALNVGNYTIPSFGLVEWTETSNPNPGDTLLHVRRPTEDGLLNFAINGRVPIPPQSSRNTGAGLVTMHFPAYVAVDGSPVAFQPLGTVANSFLAGTNRPGMLAIGNLNNGRMRVTYGGVDPKAIGAPLGAITSRVGTQPGGGSFMIQRIAGGVLVATAFSVMAYHLGGSYLQEEVDFAHLSRDYFGEWQIKKIIQPELECEVGSGVAEDTECLTTDRLCFLVGNDRVREVTLPHGVRIRDVSVDNAECNDNTIGTIDLCNLPCGGSGSGVSAEACFEAMQGRDFVLSLTGGITADIELNFQNASAWFDLMAEDETWAGTATTGWRASYSSGGCDFELFLTYQAGDGWIYWLNAYGDKRPATLNTCDPFNIEIALECAVEENYCLSCETPPTDFESVGVYADNGDLITELSTESVEAVDCNGDKYNINFDTFIKAWSGTGFDGRFRFFAAIEQTDGIEQDEFLYHLFWCPSDQYGAALYQTSKNCADSLHESGEYLTLRTTDIVDGSGNEGAINFRFYGNNCD